MPLFRYFLPSRRTSPVIFILPLISPGLHRNGSSAQIINQTQYFLEQTSRHGNLGQLEGDITAMADDFGPDLHQFLPHRGQRPMRNLFGQGQCSHEVGEIVGQGMKLEANLVVAELAA